MDTGSLKMLVLFSFETNNAMVARLPWDWKDPEAVMENRPMSTQSAPPTPGVQNVSLTEMKPAVGHERPKGILKNMKSFFSPRKGKGVKL